MLCQKKFEICLKIFIYTISCITILLGLLYKSFRPDRKWDMALICRVKTSCFNLSIKCVNCFKYWQLRIQALPVLCPSLPVVRFLHNFFIILEQEVRNRLRVGARRFSLTTVRRRISLTFSADSSTSWPAGLHSRPRWGRTTTRIIRPSTAHWNPGSRSTSTGTNWNVG